MDVSNKLFLVTWIASLMNRNPADCATLSAPPPEWPARGGVAGLACGSSKPGEEVQSCTSGQESWQSTRFYPFVLSCFRSDQPPRVVTAKTDKWQHSWITRHRNRLHTAVSSSCTTVSRSRESTRSRQSRQHNTIAVHPKVLQSARANVKWNQRVSAERGNQINNNVIYNWYQIPINVLTLLFLFVLPTSA